jgi:hypothetical protein
MRLNQEHVITDHALFNDIGAEDHHVTAVTARIIVNALSIPSGTYVHNVALGKTGCRTVQGIIRGNVNVDIQGHTGVWFIGYATAQNSSSIGLRPYPSGTQSYVGGYSRLHGDTYLSHGDFGDNVIRLLDVYISGSNAVFTFFNPLAFNRTLRVWGSMIAK